MKYLFYPPDIFIHALLLRILRSTGRNWWQRLLKVYETAGRQAPRPLNVHEGTGNEIKGHSNRWCRVIRPVSAPIESRIFAVRVINLNYNLPKQPVIIYLFHSY